MSSISLNLKLVSIYLVLCCTGYKLHAQKISARYQHSMVVCDNGSVKSWGYNSFGQLGDGTTIQRNQPVQAVGVTNAVAIVSHASDAFALQSNGNVLAWGNNSSGQLGQGYVSQNILSPVSPIGVSNIIKLACNGGNALALKNNGTVWTWGLNNYGQLGDSTNTDKTTPFQIPGLTGVTDIAAGNGHCLFLKADGKVWATGNNTTGMLGDGTIINRNFPVLVQGLSDIIAIEGGDNYSMALKNDGTVWAWGADADGTLGNGGANTLSTTPVQVSNLTNVIAISAGGDHALALTGTGDAWAWGANNRGQLGNGTNTPSNIPVQVSGLNNIVEISAGWTHSLCLKNDGTVYSWGANYYGQLGNGTTTDNSTVAPVAIQCTISTGIDDIENTNNNLFLFPNPSNGRFKTQSAQPIESLYITNCLGEVVYAGLNIIPYSEINLSDKSAGIYVATINTKGTRHSQKLIIY